MDERSTPRDPPGGSHEDEAEPKRNGQTGDWPHVFQFGDPDPRPLISWRIKGLLQSSCVGIISGASGTGKTFTIIEACVACILGEDYKFANHAVKGRCSVLIVAAEAPH